MVTIPLIPHIPFTLADANNVNANFQSVINGINTVETAIKETPFVFFKEETTASAPGSGYTLQGDYSAFGTLSLNDVVGVLNENTDETYLSTDGVQVWAKIIQITPTVKVTFFKGYPTLAVPYSVTEKITVLFPIHSEFDLLPEDAYTNQLYKTLLVDGTLRELTNTILNEVVDAREALDTTTYPSLKDHLDALWTRLVAAEVEVENARVALDTTVYANLKQHLDSLWSVAGSGSSSAAEVIDARKDDLNFAHATLRDHLLSIWSVVRTTQTEVQLSRVTVGGATYASLNQRLDAMEQTNEHSFNSDVVTVQHNLGFRPIVNVVDADGNVIFPGSIQHTSVDRFNVYFSEPVSGYVLYK